MHKSLAGEILEEFDKIKYNLFPSKFCMIIKNYIEFQSKFTHQNLQLFNLSKVFPIKLFALYSTYVGVYKQSLHYQYILIVLLVHDEARIL